MEIPNYLFFHATYDDGTQIVQNADDVGSVEGRNCYYDVLQKGQPVCFVLAGEGYPTFGVDLRDGHFEVNGIPFFQHQEPLRDFRLVYFRNVQIHRTMGVDGSNAKDTSELGYILGWETEYKGETVTRFLKVG